MGKKHSGDPLEHAERKKFSKMPRADFKNYLVALKDKIDDESKSLPKSKLRKTYRRLYDLYTSLRRRERRELQSNGVAVEIPKSFMIDDHKVYLDEVVDPNDPDILEAESQDEFADYFRGERDPKILMTTGIRRPGAALNRLISELTCVIPNSTYFPVGGTCNNNFFSVGISG